MEVSSKVSLGVSREVAPAEGPERLQSRGKSTRAGRYLVRSGSIYLFQIKVPKDLCGGAPSPFRVSLGALTADEDIILGDMIEWEAYRWRLDDMFSAEGVPLNIKLEASNTLALLGLVAAGLGVTIYPESLINFLGRNVEVRPILHPGFRTPTVLVWKRTNRAKAVLNFIEVAKHLPARG